MAVPHPIDVRVGAAVRRERKAAAWSQARLASAIGVTFQQLQKYERGTNRISASTLWRVCQALDLRPSVLFGEGEAEEDVEPRSADVLLATLVQRLKPGHRRAVLAVVDALRGNEPATT